MGLTTLPHACVECIEIRGTSSLLDPSGPIEAGNGIALRFTCIPVAYAFMV
jgi:hypothetical protein